MSVFVDTSALLALLDADDRGHVAVDAAWRRLAADAEQLVTTNYVILETFALAQRRLGTTTVEAFATIVVPGLDVCWVDADTHDEAVAAVLTANRRHLSLVDCVSFVVMREQGIQRVATLDRHFAEQGFEVLPGSESPTDGE